jgi:hypothetical protein
MRQPFAGSPVGVAGVLAEVLAVELQAGVPEGVLLGAVLPGGVVEGGVLRGGLSGSGFIQT